MSNNETPQKFDKERSFVPFNKEPVDVQGVIVVDKPKGVTSHDVVGKVRRLVGSKARRKGKSVGVKVGHAGTLDPGATGVLVVCLGSATRLVPWLQASTKTYEAVIGLGRTTDSLDDDGVETSRSDASHVTLEDINNALSSFIGDIEQIPPMVSAVRIDGERLHEKARRGEIVKRDPRPVTIHSIELQSFTPASSATASIASVTVTVVCSAGTYIRTLADDLGSSLGVGGYLQSLRRTISGNSTLDNAVGMEELDLPLLLEHIQTMEEAMSFLPRVVLDDDMAERLRNGQRPVALGLDSDTLAVDKNGDIVGIVHDQAGKLVSKIIVHNS